MADQREIDEFFKALRTLVEKHIRPSCDWYATHTAGPRILFRLSGICVVVGSLLLPVVSTATSWYLRDRVLTAVSLGFLSFRA